MGCRFLVRCPPDVGLGRHHQLRALLAAKRAGARSGLSCDAIEIAAGAFAPSAVLRGSTLRLQWPAASLAEASSIEALAEEFAQALRGRRAEPPAAAAEPPRSHPGRPKALFFRSLLNSSDKELGADHLYQGVFYIVSALKQAGLPFVLVDGRLSLEAGRLVTRPEALERALRDHPDVNFVGLTLFDAYFEKARDLIALIKRRCPAFVAVGGSMPSQNPAETLAHLPEADFLVRGAGETAVPSILEILGSATTRTGLDEGQLEALGRLDGVWAAQPGVLQAADPDHVIRIEDLDRSPLDFSILERGNVSAGTVLYFSRGCPYACLFCTSQDKARFSGKSAKELARTLSAYGRRLRQIYGRMAAVPAPAFGVGFYDDDFLSDRERALELFEVFRKSPFHIQFFQSSINSFYKRRGKEWTDELDEELLDAMPESLFMPKWGSIGPAAERPYVYIGTENYCDEELRRLGKPYGYERVERLVGELSRRRIRQAHHFIVSNAQTRPEQIILNLERIAALEKRHAPFYGVLKPVISHLVSFYSSPSYKRLASLGMLDCVKVRQDLSIPRFPEFDYPLAERDVPKDPIARELAERMPSWTSGSWAQALERALAHVKAAGAAAR